MRTFLFCLALSAAGAANADALADANKLLDAKSYAQAIPIFSMLANAGNSEAQLRLGEMYWYGEGVTVDRVKGDALFAKAAAAGNQAAAKAMTLSGERERRRGDIVYWTEKYDGADLRSGKFACAAPIFPAVSKMRDEIKSVGDLGNQYVTCYNGFADNLADAMPPGKRLPVDVLVVMSEPEVLQAKLHLDKVYAAVGAAAQAEATAVLARRDAWTAATSAYVAEENKAIEARTRTARIEMENSVRMHNMSLEQNRDVPRSTAR